jgi:hypothetical protein
MLTTDALIDQWIQTRERITEQIDVLRGGKPKIHLVDDHTVLATRRALETLLRWQAEIDETVIGLLSDFESV